MARPKKAESETYSAAIRVRCHPDDKRRIQARAKQSGLSVSEFLRRLGCADGIEIPSYSGASVAAIPLNKELNRIGGNVNKIAKAVNGGGALPDTLFGFLDQLENYLDEAEHSNTDVQTVKELNRIAVNLNQITNVLKIRGAVPAPLVRLLDRLNAFLDDAMEFNSGSTSRKTRPEL